MKAGRCNIASPLPQPVENHACHGRGTPRKRKTDFWRKTKLLVYRNYKSRTGGLDTQRESSCEIKMSDFFCDDFGLRSSPSFRKKNSQKKVHLYGSMHYQLIVQKKRYLLFSDDFGLIRSPVTQSQQKVYLYRSMHHHQSIVQTNKNGQLFIFFRRFRVN